MLAIYELLDVKRIALSLSRKYLEFNDSAFIVIEIAVIWSRKDRYDRWKLFSSRPFVHFEPFRLSFMSSDDRKHLIFLKKVFSHLRAKEIGTSSHVISFD